MVVAVMMVVTWPMVMTRQMRHGGVDRRLGARRLQRAHKTAALGPHQPGAEGCDQAVACDLDRLLGAAHGLRGDVQQPRADADQKHRDRACSSAETNDSTMPRQAVSWLATR